MKLAVLFSGGKDSVYSAYISKRMGHEIVCLVSMFSENKESYMFHIPNIEKTKKQAEVMNVPLVVQKTKGEKEGELKDLEMVLRIVKEDYGVEGVVTGAIESVYQASRVQRICNRLDLECFNPLWQLEGEEYLKELIKENFETIIVGVFAYPFNEKWLGRRLDKDFLEEVKQMRGKYGIHVAGEGGEFETFVVNCPMFSRELKIKKKRIVREGDYSYLLEVEAE